MFGCISGASQPSTDDVSTCFGVQRTATHECASRWTRRSVGRWTPEQSVHSGHRIGWTFADAVHVVFIKSHGPVALAAGQRLTAKLVRSANDVFAPHDGHSAMSSATVWCGRITRKNSLWFFPSFESLASMASECHVDSRRCYGASPDYDISQ